MSIALTTGQLEAWVAQGFFPFVRIGACLMVAPVFGARFVPPRVAHRCSPWRSRRWSRR